MPEIDRGTYKPRVRNGKKILKIMVTTIVATVICTGSLAILLTPETIAPSPATVTYTIHAPILITNDANFSDVGNPGTFGVTGGSGTLIDPFIIDGWDIDASTANGILIQNTNVHFIIRNCTVHDGGTTYSGIVLSNCGNDTATISNNTCDTNRMGIVVFQSNGIIVNNNECTSNDLYGIFLRLADYGSVVANNTCQNNLHGILLRSSNNSNIVVNNTCTMNNQNGIWLDYSCNNSILVNNGSGNTQMGILLNNADGNTINGNILQQNVVGLSMSRSNNLTVNGNMAENNSVDGIYAEYSNYLMLAGNTANNNSLDAGIWTTYVGNVTAIGNICSDQPWGLYVDSAGNFTLSYNVVTTSSEAGIFVGLPGAKNGVVSDNICTYNNYGIDFEQVSNITVTGNDCNNNSQGIYAYTMTGSTLSLNNASSNTQNGIWLDTNNAYNTLTNNTCSYNFGEGIWIYASYYNDLIGNNCSQNADCGILLNVDSGGNNITLNRFFNNLGYGVAILTGSNNVIWNNTFIKNSGSGTVYSALHIQARDDGTFNYWNSSGSPNGYGNYWADWTTPDSVSPFGIVDNPYAIEGAAGVNDEFPRTTQPGTPMIPEFSEIIIPIIGMMFVALILGMARRKQRGE